MLILNVRYKLSIYYLLRRRDSSVETLLFFADLIILDGCFYFMLDSWDLLLSEFRRLGGIADNVCQKEGEFGRGIFPVNPCVKARIFTPSNLFVKKDDIYIKDNKLRIKKDKEYDQEIRTFFNFYQDNFSWGFGGKEKTEEFEKGLSLFNSNLKQLIKRYALIDLERRHEGPWEQVIKNQFLNSRALKFKDSFFIAPVWELVNHKVKSLPFITNKAGVSTPNYNFMKSEIMHSYNNLSPLERYFSYGFYSEESIVFSLPFQINIESIGMNFTCKGRNLNDDSIKIIRSDNEIICEGLPIGDSNNPKLPYDYFDEILSRLGNITLPQDLFLRILQFNISIRKKIIVETQLIDNEFTNILLRLMNYEISLILTHD